jgi:hypothetical protein
MLVLNLLYWRSIVRGMGECQDPELVVSPANIFDGEQKRRNVGLSSDRKENLIPTPVFRGKNSAQSKSWAHSINLRWLSTNKSSEQMGPLRSFLFSLVSCTR